MEGSLPLTPDALNATTVLPGLVGDFGSMIGSMIVPSLLANDTNTGDNGSLGTVTAVPRFPPDDQWLLDSTIAQYPENMDSLRILYLVTSVPLLLLTTFGSFLIIAVMTRHATTLSAAVYFLVLALADLLFMYSHALGTILHYAGVAWTSSPFACALFPAVVAIGRCVASAAIGFIAIERSLMLVSPARFSAFARPIVAMSMCSLTAFATLVSQLPQFWAWSYDEEVGLCVVPLGTHQRKYVRNSAWTIYLLAGFLSFFVLFICCFIIGIKLVVKKRALARDPVHGNSAGAIGGGVSGGVGGRKFSTTNIVITSRRLTRVNVIVLVVATSFVVLTVPMTITEVFLLSSVNLLPWRGIEKLHAVAVILVYICHSARVFAYIFASHMFRRDALEVVRSFFCMCACFCHRGDFGVGERVAWGPCCMPCCDTYVDERTRQASLRKGQWSMNGRVIKHTSAGT